ncbi:reticulon-3 [Chanos chanos]|uniref:Reticulon n=1 Tax=Chanos chanos TaxID=29144 RepID=A0A6J2VTE2_CHACN|nr:reticulon-4-like [Chanos chanos]
MADPMTQSSQISSSQGLIDGQNSGTSKDSKLSDSFLSTSPVSLISSPQDKRVVPGSEISSEGVAASRQFFSQPNSFSSATYGSEGPSNDVTDCTFKIQEKKDFSDSLHGSVNQDELPIKPSPVSERIKALEALAAKQNDPDWSNGNFPQFKERHYEKSAHEAPTISSPLQNRPPSTEQDSPESPFEVLGDTRRGSDFEDTADWMRAHLPPAPAFHPEDSDLEENSDALLIQCDSPSKEIRTEVKDIPEAFVGVPDAFMDNPVKSRQLKDNGESLKEDSVEEESEFDLRFLPTAYMWDKQESSETEAQCPPNLQEISDSELSASPAPPIEFDSSSPPSPPGSPPSASVTNQLSAPLGGESKPTEILEIDSSGESEDTVIEDGICVRTPAVPGCVAQMSEGKETKLTGQEMQCIQVPIINVIETDEQVLSDEEEEDDNEKYERSEEVKSGSEPPEVPEPGKETPFQPTLTGSDNESHIKEENDDANERCVKSHHFVLGTSEAHSLVSSASEPPKNASFDTNEPLDMAEETLSGFPEDSRDVSNESDLCGVGSFLNKQTAHQKILEESANFGIIHESKDKKDCTLSCDESVIDESIDEVMIDESKLNSDSLPEPSTEIQLQPLHPQNSVTSDDDDDDDDDGGLERVASLGHFSLGDGDDPSNNQTEKQPSIQESFPASSPTFDKNEEMMAEQMAKDIITSEEMIMNSCNPEQDLAAMTQQNIQGRQYSTETSTDPENISSELGTAPTDSFVEFMRECLKSQLDVKSEDPGASYTTKSTCPESSAPSTSQPTMVMDLEQEHLTICALKELGSSQEEDDNSPRVQTLYSSTQEKETVSKSESSVTSTVTPQTSIKQPEVSFATDLEAVDVWVAEAYHLAEHILAAILTHISVTDLVHWRDPKKSGVVFGLSLLVLLSLATFSIISVVSYLLLALLCVTITFRIYKSVIQAVQKSSEGHPFKALMEKDVTVPPETFRKHVDVCLTYINRGLKQMSRLFLVEDLVDSLKLAVVMWLLTYVGAVFNGITILILADILLFSVPPVYEKNKTQIDHYLEIARTQFNNTIAKLQEKLPGAVKRNKME